MAKAELGTKRQCLSCGVKFYDLNKDPIACPKCGATFQAAAARPRAEAVAPRAAKEEPQELETAGAEAEVVSLQDVEADETAKEVVSEDEVELEDTETEDPFLEPEEESEDDVTGLIDGAGEDDEET